MKKPSAFDIPTRTVCFLEVVQHPRGLRPGLELVVSIPGREGTLSHFWETPHGIVGAPQLTDLVARVQKTVEDAVCTFTGAHRTLPVSS